jgi:K+ transporter
MEQTWVYTKTIRVDTTVVVLLAIAFFAFIMVSLWSVIEGSFSGLVFSGVAFYFLYIYYQVRRTPYIRTTADEISIYRYLRHKEEIIEWDNIQDILFENGKIEILLQDDKNVKIDLSLVDEEDKGELVTILKRWVIETSKRRQLSSL